LDKHLHEYWHAQGEWKWDDFSDFLSHPILARIASFEVLKEGIGELLLDWQKRRAIYASICYQHHSG